MSLSNECLMWAVHVPAHGECRNVQHARVAAGRLCCRLRSPGSSAFMPLRGWPAGASRADRADMHVCLRMAEQTPHLSKYHHMPRQAHRGGRVFDPAGPKYARYPAASQSTTARSGTSTGCAPDPAGPKDSTSSRPASCHCSKTWFQYPTQPDQAHTAGCAPGPAGLNTPGPPPASAARTAAR